MRFSAGPELDKYVSGCGLIMKKNESAGGGYCAFFAKLLATSDSVLSGPDEA